MSVIDLGLVPYCTSLTSMWRTIRSDLDGAAILDLRLSNLILQMVTNMYNLIKEAADIDNQKWNIGSIDLGYK